MPDIYIETYGCQMNEYDSGVVRALLNDDGFDAVQTPEAADVIMLNTCAIREKAHERIYNRLRILESLRKKNKNLIIGILGCMAQNLGDDLFAEGLHVDFISGPDNYRALGASIRQILDGSKEQINITQLSRSETYADIEPCVVNGPLAFVTIMRGCDNFCSFCVVPFTRGRERSRDPETIINEITKLISEQNIKEVTLLGQNVNSYKYEDFDFTSLCKQVIEKTSLERLRFTSPHPHDFPIKLLEFMGTEDRMCSQIHLPVQSGSSTVLERMKRDYSRTDFLELVKTINEIVPGIVLTTDVIVGFCGETDKEFEDTLSLMQLVKFDMAFMFHYSERELTSAHKNMPDDISLDVKKDRLQKLIEIQNVIAGARNKLLHGKKFMVMAEHVSKRSNKHLMGRTFGGKVVIFEPSLLDEQKIETCFGESFHVEITSSTSATLQGKLI